LPYQPSALKQPGQMSLHVYVAYQIQKVSHFVVVGSVQSQSLVVFLKRVAEGYEVH